MAYLCLSTVPRFVVCSPIAIAGVDIAGEKEEIEILTSMVRSRKLALISSLPRSLLLSLRQGAFTPDLRIPACVNGNPCGFPCTDVLTQPSNKPTTWLCEHALQSSATASAGVGITSLIAAPASPRTVRE